MNYKIADIDGISPANAEALLANGVPDTNALLKCCDEPQCRESLSQSTGISEKLILRWCNRADLMRIHGVGRQYAELLEATGVDTVRELSTRNAVNLAMQMVEVNKARRVLRRPPAIAVVMRWVEQAKKLEPAVTN